MSYNADPFKQSPKAFTQYPYHIPACYETTGREHYFNKALAVSVSHTGSGKEFRGPDIAEESVSNFPFGTVLIGLLKVYVFNIANLHFRFSFAAWDFY